MITLNEKKEKGLIIKVISENKIPPSKIKTPKIKNIPKKKKKISFGKPVQNEITFTDKEELESKGNYRITKIIVFSDENNTWIKGRILFFNS